MPKTLFALVDVIMASSAIDSSEGWQLSVDIRRLNVLFFSFKKVHFKTHHGTTRRSQIVQFLFVTLLTRNPHSACIVGVWRLVELCMYVVGSIYLMLLWARDFRADWITNWQLWADFVLLQHQNHWKPNPMRQCRLASTDFPSQPL